MKAGVARIDITPTESIWMEGMLRKHRSEGVHDHTFVKALVLANDEDLAQGAAIVSLDVCGMPEWLSTEMRGRVESELGIPAARIIMASKHIHSGPDTDGTGEPEVRYTQALKDNVFEAVEQACAAMEEVKAGCASGRECTISQYRRLLADDGHVVMNWEIWPPDRLVAMLGVPDPEVGVLKITDLAGRVRCILFNYAGHPNVLSGDNYLISAEYPGHAERLLEAEFGGTAIFVNGAQGSVDIDSLGPRTWAEMERLGAKLAAAVAETARCIEPVAGLKVRSRRLLHWLPPRQVSDEQLAWAEAIVKQTGGTVQPLADGVGDDFKALLLKRLRGIQDQPIPAEQVAIAVGDTAFISFPGELFTEIGLKIKAASPFLRTYIFGLSNGAVGYLPTRKSIAEGGYAEDVRRVDAGAETAVIVRSLELLGELSRS
jgi:hypothetical protein